MHALELSSSLGTFFREVKGAKVWHAAKWMPRIVLPLILTILGCNAGPAPQAWTANSYIDFLTQAPAEGFAKVQGPREFNFPADHGAHPRYRTEWWYFTGVVHSADDIQYGYQLTFFRFALSQDGHDEHMPHSMAYQRSSLLMGHFALTDVTDNSHASFERFSRDGASLGGVQLDRGVRIWLEDWSAQIDADGQWELSATAGEGPGAIALDFSLQTDTAPLLHGDQGYSRKGPDVDQANYYYSLVHLDTRGTLYLGGQPVTVTGISWMDHEWGTSALPSSSAGWDWFGLQLDDGTALMAAQVRTSSGKPEPSFVNSLLTWEGQLHKLDQSQIQIEVREHWQSPRTEVIYPAAWQILIPDAALECQVKPLVSDQEFVGLAVYWEGVVSADCLQNGSPVTGQGYIELTGYGAIAPS